MSTQKDRIEKLETDVHEIRTSIQNLERLWKEISYRSAKEKESQERSMQMSITRSVQEALATFAKKQGEPPSRPEKEKEKEDREEGSNPQFSHHRDHRGDGHHFRPMKMEFPKFWGDDPLIWLDHSTQFFEFQATAEEQKVTLVAFYLEGEANQWWLWVKKIYQEEDKLITWAILEKELLARFGPTEYEDYDEALSHVKQKGSLREYQKEFEKLANRVVGWPQKALIGTFLGGLKADISANVQKFKLRTLRETIEFARMREDELAHSKRSPYVNTSKYNPKTSWGSSTTSTVSSSSKISAQPAVKKISLEEM